MRHFFTIFSHELRMLLLNPSTYVAAVLFLLVMGFAFQGILESYAGLAQEVSPASAFFSLFWLPVFFMVPLLTMKSLAEERRAGTLETLLAAPVTATEVVLGKFAASYTLYALLWLSTGGFVAILHSFARDVRLLDPGPLIGGYVFVLVTGLLFVALGIFASALARSQAVAGVLAFALLFTLIIGLRLVVGLPLFEEEALRPVRDILRNLQVFQHLEDFTRGVVDTRQIVFYLTGTALALVLGVLGVEAKILRS
jgi:ABC-2 type transport system permease protein